MGNDKPQSVRMKEFRDNGKPSVIDCHSPCSGLAEYNDDIGKYVCEVCGRVSDAYETSNNGWVTTNHYEEDYIRIAGVISIPGESRKCIIKSPYSAKNEIKKLDIKSTGRKWNNDLSAWTIDCRAVSLFKEHMEDSGWFVIDTVTDHE
jgi:hypothetical protein